MSKEPQAAIRCVVAEAAVAAKPTFVYLSTEAKIVHSLFPNLSPCAPVGCTFRLSLAPSSTNAELPFPSATSQGAAVACETRIQFVLHVEETKQRIRVTPPLPGRLLAYGSSHIVKGGPGQAKSPEPRQRFPPATKTRSATDAKDTN